MEAALRLLDFFIIGKFERYVSHMRDSKSSRKSWGQSLRSVSRDVSASESFVAPLAMPVEVVVRAAPEASPFL